MAALVIPKQSAVIFIKVSLFKNEWILNSILILEHSLFKNASKLPAFFVTDTNSNDWIVSQWHNTDKKERSYIDALFMYHLWYKNLNDFNFVTKKADPLEP